MDTTSPDPSFDHTYLAGSLLAACVFNWGLFGVLCVQLYLYYMAFPHDRVLAKVLVHAVFLNEFIQTIIITNDIWKTFAQGFGNMQSLNSMHTYWFTIPVSGGLAGSVGQLFFAYRIARISESKVVPYTISLLGIIAGGSAMGAAVQFHMAGTFTSILSGNTLAAVGIWNGTGALCDVIISVTMPYFLLRGGTGLPETHDLITKIIRLAIETGVFTALIAIAHLVLYFITSPSFIVIGLTISKIYSNTMLALLNNRMEIVGGRAAVQRALDESSTEPFQETRSRIHVSRDRLTIRLNDIPVNRGPHAFALAFQSPVTDMEQTSQTSGKKSPDILESLSHHQGVV